MLAVSPADSNLYAGVHIDFMSTDAALFRTMGGRTAIRTEQYDSRWLNGESSERGEEGGSGACALKDKSGLGNHTIVTVSPGNTNTYVTNIVFQNNSYIMN